MLVSAFLGVPAEVYLFSVSDDWCSINVEGPEHYVLAVHDYPEKPFASGCFQLAFKAGVISGGAKFLSKDKQYVFKQHHLQEYGLMEDSESTSCPSDLSEEFLEQLRIANEKKTAKVTFVQCYPLVNLFFSLTSVKDRVRTSLNFKIKIQGLESP